jgi:hypothetical protein
MENPLIEKTRIEIQNTLRALAMEHSLTIVDEWREVLRVTGKCKNLKEAINLLTECVHASEIAGERIEKPKHSGKWIWSVFAQRLKISRQNEIALQEQRERERRRQEESQRIANECATLGIRSMQASELIPALEATQDDRAILWAGFAKKNPTPFILSNCRRLLRELSQTQPAPCQ